MKIKIQCPECKKTEIIEMGNEWIKPQFSSHPIICRKCWEKKYRGPNKEDYYEKMPKDFVD